MPESSGRSHRGAESPAATEGGSEQGEDDRKRGVWREVRMERAIRTGRNIKIWRKPTPSSKVRMPLNNEGTIMAEPIITSQAISSSKWFLDC